MGRSSPPGPRGFDAYGFLGGGSLGGRSSFCSEPPGNMARYPPFAFFTSASTWWMIRI